jgi:hypothetical protein
VPGPATLNDYLDLCATETNLTLGVTGPATRALQAALVSDPTMRDEAQVVVAGTKDLEDRDHVTRWRNALLRNALAGIVP